MWIVYQYIGCPVSNMNDILKKLSNTAKLLAIMKEKENPCEICLINCFSADFWQFLGHDLDPYSK